ncbi:hypothetical protein [Ruminococcus sp.]|jgi:hypothetical protein|uniref:hypothetical protein n=1 Tax=Ruminococcus sp. TaxID=41978 RepID=UPI003AB41B22
MTITLNSDYDVTLSTALLGYVGETNARPVSVEGLTVDGADRYVLTIDYGDGVQYEVDITGGQWTPTADILRSAQTVSCQICAKKLSGQEYILVKKSRIFRLRIGAAIGDNAIPLPSVAADALDRIDAIGRQAHADMQTAVTAAETATTAAENAKKSATAAGLSADTATQAAKRAETAQASAETSATQADTARQGAETARQQAVTAQNAAKISAAQASTAAQQTEADKTITAGYAKTAKTCADSTAADRQAVQDMATKVTADKATVADHAAKVAEDRTAAETAAQTAQAVADSLPDDYVTAVGKIAENTAEIANVKLTDKELQRRVNALYSIGQGITHQFETDTDTAYQKTVPTGAKLMSVKNIGGRSIVFNQIFQPRKEANNGATVTADSDGMITINGTTTASYINFRDVTPEQNKVGKYAFKLLILNNPDSISMKFSFLNRSQSTPAITSGSSAVIYNQTQSEISLGKATGISGFAVGTVFNDVKIKIQIFDLTTMFGAGNEPSTVEEFEKMFPADYYPYNAGEIISAGTEEIVEQGKNLFDIEKCVSLVPYYGFEIDTNKTLKIALKDKKTCPTGVSFGIVYIFHDNTMANWLITSKGVVGAITDSSTMVGATQVMVACYPGNKETMQSIADAFDIMLVDGIYKSDTMPAYAPFHRNEYPIPETIKALSGYGIEGNVTDYEAKTYTQNNTIDGTAIKALDTPIVTDISTLIPDDFLRNIEVEAGGSVIFKNSNDNYHIPVPSEEEYIVKLSEVGGTT